MTARAKVLATACTVAASLWFVAPGCTKSFEKIGALDDDGGVDAGGGSGGTGGADAGGAGGPTGADGSVLSDCSGLGPDVIVGAVSGDASVQTYAFAAVASANTARDLRVQVGTACVALAEALSQPDTWTAAGYGADPTDESVSAACTAVLVGLDALIDQGARIQSISASGGYCEVDGAAQLACEEGCDPNGVCPAETLEARCATPACAGQCTTGVHCLGTAEAPVPCEGGTCAGTCFGVCSAGCGFESGGLCAGSCDGSCFGDCAGACAVDQPSCPGGLPGTCLESCSGIVDASFCGALTDASCPQAIPACLQACGIEALLERSCSDVVVLVDPPPTGFDALDAPLEEWLPDLIAAALSLNVGEVELRSGPLAVQAVPALATLGTSLAGSSPGDTECIAAASSLAAGSATSISASVQSAGLVLFATQALVTGGDLGTDCSGTFCASFEADTPAGVVRADACCPEVGSSACGLDISQIAAMTNIVYAPVCQERPQPGVVTSGCPNADAMVTNPTNVAFTLPGCCRPDGQCGYWHTNISIGGLLTLPLDLGCISANEVQVPGASPPASCDAAGECVSAWVAGAAVTACSAPFADCLCTSCFQAVTECLADVGCAAILTCSRDSGCEGPAECYAACQALVDANGGPTGAAAQAAGAVSGCAQTANCECTTCTAYCNDIAQTCTGGNDQYPAGDCSSACEGFSVEEFDCRRMHLDYAMQSDPTMHCPHAGPTGGGICP